MTRERAAVYPGTFDPIHKGHLDVIERATRLVDRLVVAVAVNIGKDPLLDLDARVALVAADLRWLADDGRANGCVLEVRPFAGLTVRFAREHGATMIVRGLRAVSDFEYEFQMAANNKRLAPEIETVFLTASETNQFISSRFVKEIRRLGGDVSIFVTPAELARLPQPETS